MPRDDAKVICTFKQSTETYRIVMLTQGSQALFSYVIERRFTDAMRCESWVKQLSLNSHTRDSRDLICDNGEQSLRIALWSVLAELRKRPSMGQLQEAVRAQMGTLGESEKLPQTRRELEQFMGSMMERVRNTMRDENNL